MARYMTLLNFTPQGAKAIDKSVERSRAVRELAQSMGIQVEAIYWAQGEFDGVVLYDAPDPKLAAALPLAMTRAGNVQTRTTRLFDESEFAEIMAALPAT